MRVFANLLDVVGGVGGGPAVNAGHWLTKRGQTVEADRRTEQLGKIKTR